MAVDEVILEEGLVAGEVMVVAAVIQDAVAVIAHGVVRIGDLGLGMADEGMVVVGVVFLSDVVGFDVAHSIWQGLVYETVHV